MILPSWEDGMGAKLLLAAILGPAIGLALSGCFGPEHPDYTRYEYLYIDGAFQPPYKEFPTGNARGEWKCFDPSTAGGSTISTSTARGAKPAICRRPRLDSKRRLAEFPPRLQSKNHVPRLMSKSPT
jgi:hypothetical protein